MNPAIFAGRASKAVYLVIAGSVALMLAHGQNGDNEVSGTNPATLPHHSTGSHSWFHGWSGGWSGSSGGSSFSSSRGGFGSSAGSHGGGG